MRILVINPIMYTSETRQIKRADSIKDTMMYDLCLAFHELGHRVTLAGGEPFRPLEEERYPFEVLWWKCVWTKIFLPHRIPFMPETFRNVKTGGYDLVLTSEVFSVNSLLAYRAAPQKTLVWHELAKHNAMMKQIPSRFWYCVVVRLLMKNVRVVARSEQAKEFIRRYCRNTDDRIIDHGVNLDRFHAKREKKNYFVVCSQLIARKRIHGILEKFRDYLDQYDPGCHLYVIGSGELEESLKNFSRRLKMEDHVVFTGKMSHSELIPVLAEAKALLVNTEKDNNMISIVESIAAGTPIVTTEVPLNSVYIREYGLGIVQNEWGADDLDQIVKNNAEYVQNCMAYREKLSTKEKAGQFITISHESAKKQL